MNIMEILKVYVIIGFVFTFIILYGYDEYTNFRDVTCEFIFGIILWPFYVIVFILCIIDGFIDSRKGE